MISEDEVKHIAKLARLELSEKEIKKMQKDLSEILDYFNVLKNAPKAEIGSVKSEIQNLRSDEAQHSPLSGEIVRSAPDKKEGYIKVKTIL